MSGVADNLAVVNRAVADALDRTGRPQGSCRLLAVTKKIPPDEIRRAADAGQRLFGESRVQEALEKIPLLPAPLEWHFIGHLQRNKIRKVLPLVTTIHSIDSLDLARATDRVADELGLFPRVFLEANVAGDRAKFGFTPASLRAAIGEILAFDRLQTVGLMTIPPYSLDPEDSRRHFAALRQLRDQVSSETGVPLPELSMGMSGDFTVAVEEGATIVRVGTSIFGDRV
jgi:pyridoxal phosphate enzyme (YggS family)